MLFLLAIIARGAHPSPELWLQGVLSGTAPGPGALALALLSGTLSLAIVLAGFGTLGLFWPLFALGALLGSLLASVSAPWLGEGAMVAVLVFAGGAALWGALLGTPVCGAVVAFELTREPTVLLPCLAAAFVAQELRRLLRSGALAQGDLEARGMGLLGGRSAEVLAAIPVRDAIVSDYEVVHEQEPLSEIRPRLLKSRYPFLPVSNAQGLYTGLLTIDVIQEAWRTQSEHSNSPLSELFEAKDLLYRSGLKPPTLNVSGRLSDAAGVFDSAACVPVLNDEGRVVGLLFGHNVRLAYDREMTRRSLEDE